MLARSFGATAAVRTNVLLVSQSSSQNDICFVIPSADVKRTVEALRGAFAGEIAEKRWSTFPPIPASPSSPWSAKTCRDPGIAGRTFGVLGRDGVNIIAIAQGSSEYNISFVVEAKAMQRAVATLHKEFGLANAASGIQQPVGSGRCSRPIG